MADVSLSITFHGETAELAIEVLNAAISSAGLSMFLNTRARNWLQERAEARFTAEGDDAAGGPWVPLADSTVRTRIALGFDEGPINVRTGNLRNSVTRAKGNTFPDSAGATMMWPGSGDIADSSYFAYRQAQRGGVRNQSPARPVVALDITDAAGILALLGNWVIGPEVRASIK